ncbi:uncharacterized protein SAPINGB_P004935 [Magnusiomyces paraingens]|uniref:Class II aldolase/adducin N-terminal domain-containing protein n=1 Tax=Magnusiomyces paraingens TaxID=2606893 RepID=A0A5E8C081_9ASCO|nr:uncharacterized protein SAPINGB_P004935 [Saprochaete ingens]VVT56290.1 unnamed protein product [Saprochaete ingens]
MSQTVTITQAQQTQTIKATGSKLEQQQPELKGFSLGPDPYPRPTFTDKHEQRRWMLQHLAGAYRVFARNGYLEGSAGHLSIRDPVDPTTFWINPLGKHFALIKASDMVQVDEDSNVINVAANILGKNESTVTNKAPRNIAINLAGFKIHSELHKARPDVWAACHAHSIHGKAYSAFGKPLEMINQDACIFYKTHAVYDNFGGIVLDANEGKHIAEALGARNKALILKNHGLLTVGETIDEAAYLFGLMERSCKIQLLADAAEGNRGLKKEEIPDQIAQFTWENTASADILYQEFQPELEYETHLDDSYLK